MQSRFEGSLRQLRGRILSAIIEKQKASLPQLESMLGAEPRLPKALGQLVDEGFLRNSGGRYSFR